MVISKKTIVIFRNFFSKSYSLTRPLREKFNYYKLLLTVDYLGENVKVYSFPKLYHPNNILIGNHCTINFGVVIGGLGGVEIGDRVRISDGVTIHSGYLDIENRSKHLCKPVKIRNSVWLASGSIILPGVEIGDNSVVAAGAVVTKSVPPDSFVSGVPALFRPLKVN